MSDHMATRRGFLALSTSLAAMLAGCAAQKTEGSSSGAGGEGAASQGTSAQQREAITDNSDGGHAIAVSVDTATYESVDVTKTGNADGDEADFYGHNAAVYAEQGATLELRDVSVTTDGTHANAVFSYGEGTTVNISDSTIETSNNCSGGIMVTGGGTLNAKNLTVHTAGNSSASIRSDRGGGVQNVEGGTFTTNGKGSPAIYSTAEVHVKNAQLTSTSSQGVVVEGKNSVELVGCTLSADNNTKNSDKSEWFQAVMIYQSMSGDAAQGAANFSMEGGTLANANGDVFFVNNTVATIGLAGVAIQNNDASGLLLRAAAAGWGSEGSNGGQVTLNAEGQELSGNVVVDSVSSLNMHLRKGSTFVGGINPEGAAGEVFVEVEDGSVWELSADSHITSLTCGTSGISLKGHTLMVGDAAYAEGTASTGEQIEAKVSESSGNGGPGGAPGGGAGEPPSGVPGEAPGGSGSGGPGGEKPPAKPGEQA